MKEDNDNISILSTRYDIDDGGAFYRQREGNL